MKAHTLELAFRKQVSVLSEYRRWVIGFSGGVDSAVLLHLCATVPDHPPITLIHVNHKLQSVADQWQCFSEKIAKTYKVGFHSQAVELASAAEAVARDARYHVFEGYLEADDCLLLGHHADDQMETMLFRLCRGTGPDGLAGIPKSRAVGTAQLFRPLLDFTRRDIEEYASEKQLEWVEDPSNAESHYDRNYIRHNVIPSLEQRWSGCQSLWQQAAELQAVQNQLLDEIAQENLESVLETFGGLSCEGLSSFSHNRQRNLLRYWLYRSAGERLNSAALDVIQQQVVGAGQDRQPEYRLGSCSIRRYRNCLFLVPSHRPEALEIELRLVSGETVLKHGQLIVSEVVTGGLKKCGALSLRYRTGGEKIQLPGREGRHSVKKLLKDTGIPPWLRSGWPLLYQSDQLVAIPGVAIAEGWQQKEEGESGYSLNWLPVTLSDSADFATL